MSTITKILIVEHNPYDIELIERELKTGGIIFESEAVQNEHEYRNALKNFIPDIILSDYSLPSFNGQTIFEIREDIAADTPFIFVSGSIGEENSIEYIKSGVTDYALKDKLFTLTVKVKRALKDAKEKQEKNKINIEFRQALKDLQKIMNSSLDVICSIDGEGNFVNVSFASERIFGFKPEELKGRNHIDLVFPDDVENTRNAVAGIMNGIPVTFFENRYISKNGSLVPVIWSATWDDKDKLMYCIAKDATEKKQLEKAFEIERKRFYDLFLQAPSCMGILRGSDHIFEMANPLYLQLIGKKDILGKAVKEVLPEIVEQGFIEILDDVYNAGKPFSANEMLIKLDRQGKGELVDIYLNFIYQAYRNNEGSIEGIFFFAVEVTELVLSRKKIEESENRFRALIEKSTDMKTLSTEDGEILYGSPSVTKILGYTFEEFLHKSPVDFIHPDDIPAFVEKRKEINNTPGKSFFYQLRLCHKNGNWIWCEGTTTNMLHEKGINAFVSNFRDISQNKIAEQQREFDRNNLNALINNTNDLMWSVDRDFNLITSNKPFDDTMMFMSGSVVAKGDNILKANFSPDQTNRFKKSYERAFKGDAFREIEYSSILSEYWSEISYCPIRNSDKIVGVACHSRDITQMKMNEKTIKDERILLRTLIDNLPISIYTKDIHSKKTLSNRTDYEFIGVTSEEDVLGKDDSWFFSDETSKYTRIEEQQIFYTGEPIINKEEHQKKKDGSTIWFLKSKIPLRNQHNEIVGLVGISHDITERIRAEEQLKKSEAFNRGVLNSLSSHIAVIDASGNIVAINEAWKHFGLENGETTLQRSGLYSNYYKVCESSSITGDKIAAEALKGIKGVMNDNNTSFYFEYPCHAPDKQRWFGMRVMKFASDAPMVVISHQNISERKLAERNLLKSESRLIEAQSLAHIGNWEVDFQTNIHTWSGELYNILGIKEGEANPSLEYYLSFMHPEDIDCVKIHIKETYKILKATSYNFRFIRKDGAIRHGYTESKFDFDKNNKPVRIYGIVQDITERKLAELKLEEKNAELTKTNFELDRFVYSVSHDLRSPLTSVLGLVSFIEEESKEAETLEYAKLIKNNVNRLDGYIKNILNYSRNNRTHLEVQKIPLQKTINEIVDSLHHMKDAEGINFEVNIREHQPFYSDLQSFNTIIENLISNAIKFQKEEISGRLIKISGKSDKHNLKLTIEDNGIGIAAEHHDKIFNMFFRLSGKTGGSGIGLYIVKEMIGKLHGSIQVNSQEGVGTSFTIKLKNLTPVINLIPIGTESKLKNLPAMTNIIPNFIVLDDDSDNNMMCGKIIKKVFPEAYVLTFTEPDIALGYITSTYDKASAPDAVLFLDINMPVLSGWDFLDAFERFDIRIKAHLKIYMLTSSFDQRDKQRAAENKNVLDYFEKPLTREKVESVGNIISEVIDYKVIQ